MTTEKTLADLKVGDRVVMKYYYGDPGIAYITHVTPKQLEIGWMRFWKEGGSQIGGFDKINPARIYPLSDEWLERIEWQRFYTKFHNYNFTKLPLETLQAIDALLPKDEPKQVAA